MKAPAQSSSSESSVLVPQSESSVLTPPSESSVLAPPPDDSSPSLPPRPYLWQRILAGGACLTLGVLAIGVGIASISYRLSHIRVDGGLVNGRTVRIQAPIDGKIQDFYARPGVSVQTGQVLAQLDPLPEPENDTPLPRLRQVNQVKAVQLASAQQSLALLNQQLQEIISQDEALETATVSIATMDVSHSDAEVDAAIAQETVARTQYERFRSLLAAGAVSEQQVDELAATWRLAQANVQQAESERTIAQVTAAALKQQTPLQSTTKDLQSQQRQLRQEIQDQTALVNTLALEYQAQQSQLEQVQERSGNPPAVAVTAPFEGVIYNTQHDAGEYVNRPTVLLSLLDCNDLWVEALVATEKAKRIDDTKPVRVQLASQTETVVGEVGLISAMSASELTQARAEALLPAIPSNLVNQPLARVRVRIPSVALQNQVHQFCGVGQSARLTFGTH